MRQRKYSFWLALIALGGATAGCEAQSPNLDTKPIGTVKSVAPEGTPAGNGVLQIGRLAHPRLTECSGVVASRQFPGTLWVHNDGGGPKRQVLYAIDPTGQPKAEFSFVDSVVNDWEDIAIDHQRHLYLADIGNNEARRSELVVHQVDEPNPAGPPGPLHATKSWRLRFAAAPFDAEAFFVWNDHGYIVSKVFKDERAEIHRFPLSDAKQPLTLEFVARTKIESPVTGADLSADGRRLALVAKSGAFLFTIDGDVSRANKEKGVQVKFRHDKVEGCTFTPQGLLAVAESREIFLFTDPMFREPAGP